ncbi:MAG: hypothetical protein WAM97_11495 [Acidimicrobiales bacterium]
MTQDDPSAWRTLGELYHRYLTGTILAIIVRAGTRRAADVVYETLRTQQEEKFLPGLHKLGLGDLPPAVACAKYHVLSNTRGGVSVEWIPETDRKSWIRYLPPRWIFDGASICGIPTEVSRAMLWGWHGNNGQALGNDHLGFVCTMQTTDGQPGLEGYFIEEEGPLAPADRVRFRPGERPSGSVEGLATEPLDDIAAAKSERNYAVTYARSLLPSMCRVLGPADAGSIGRTAGRQVAMQYHASVLEGLGESPASTAFAERLARLLRAHGDDVSVDHQNGESTVSQRDWRIFDGLHVPGEVFEAWNGLWEGLAAMEGVRLLPIRRLDLGDQEFAWRVVPERAHSRLTSERNANAAS